MKLYADDKIRTVATSKNDHRILSIASDELVAKGARYHPTCYRDYTRPDKQPSFSPDSMKIDLLKTFVDDLLNESEDKIISFTEVKNKYVSSLENNGFDKTNATKNLKRSIKRNISKVQLSTINQDDILFPKRLTVGEILKYYLQATQKLKEYEKISNVEKEIMTSATKIRGELKNSSYKINWPPKSQDLDVQSFPEFPLLQRFLVRLISDEVNPKIDCVKRLSISIAQDLFFAVHNGKRLTPKSVLLPLQIKSLTNNTELITTISRLGHGISYTKLSEVTTEIAYSIINNNLSGRVCLPEQCQKCEFTMIVEDNIDRNEQTLTGRFQRFTVFKFSKR